MPIKDIFDKMKDSSESDYVELNEGEEIPTSKMLIEVEHMGDSNDTDRIQKKVRDGMILLVKIKDLKDKDVSELKRAVEKIKRTTMAIDGEVVGLGEDWLIVTPSTAKVHREQAE